MKKIVVSMGIAFAIICAVGIAMISGYMGNEAIEAERSYNEIAYAYACCHEDDSIDEVKVTGVEIVDGEEYIDYIAYENGETRSVGYIHVGYAESVAF